MDGGIDRGNIRPGRRGRGGRCAWSARPSSPPRTRCTHVRAARSALGRRPYETNPDARWRRSWRSPSPRSRPSPAARAAPADDPILRLSAEESLATGKELLAREKYARARPYFTHAFEVEPNSAVGREALLLAADTYYLEGGSANFVQAEAKYRDFLNRFPTSEQAAYVQFQIANSLAKRMEKPDRDQTVTRKALEAYQELVRLYPTSEYAAQAQEQIEVVRANLAEHEFVVGRFYLRYGLPRRGGASASSSCSTPTPSTRRGTRSSTTSAWPTSESEPGGGRAQDLRAPADRVPRQPATIDRRCPS